MPTRNVVLTDHHEKVIEELVRSGRYQNASEVLREGIRLIEKREAADKAKLEALRAAIQVAQDDLEAGRYVEFDTADDLDAYLKGLGEEAGEHVAARPR